MNNKINIEELIQITQELRGKIIETSHKANIPHLGSCLSCVEMLVAIYFGVISINFEKLDDPERDRFILSKGHAAPALFQVLARKSFFPESLMNDYGGNGSLFAEHPPAHGVPGIEAATGSLGHGLPIGLGMAMSSRIKKINNRIFVLMSDGECNEGSNWEAAMMAASQKMGNLTVLIDYNKWQATGRSKEVLALDPLNEKWEAFGWNVCEVDGHDLKSLLDELDSSKMLVEKPKAIIAHTIKGKGISFMEDDNNWHYRTPTSEEVILAKKELGLI